MRFRKWISILTVLCLLCAVIPASVAEDEVIAEEEIFLEVEEDSQEIAEAELTEESVEAIDDIDLSELYEGGEEEVVEPGLAEIGTEIEDTDTETADQAVPTNASSDFVIDEDGVLTKYTGFDKDVVIPNGVKEIGGSVFANDKIMETVSIPNSVTYIGSWAFEYCSNLKSVTIPDSVTDVGYGAFYGCSSLTSVKLSSGLTHLGSSMFSGCSSLETISIPNNITDIYSGALAGCGFKSITIPGTVKSIGMSAFRDCSELNSVVLSNGVTSIGENAFGGCNSLESITVPNSVTSIDRNAFEGSANAVIRGSAGSYAERYANGVGIPFNAPVVTFNEETYWCIEEANTFEGHFGVVVYQNQTRALKAVQKPSDLATTLKWSSSNTSVATVDQNGNVKGISQGTATITAATANGKGKAAQIKISVPKPVEIELDFYGGTIYMGETDTVYAYYYTPYSDDTGITFSLTWGSSDNSTLTIESINENKATIRGIQPGKATITATTPDGGKASTEIEVLRPKPDKVEIDQPDEIKLFPGDTYALSATVSPAEADSTVYWTTEDTGVVTVSDTGVVTAVGSGYAWVEAKTAVGYCYDYIYIEVLSLDPEDISLNKTSAKLGVKEKLYLTATLYPDYAQSGLTWKSSKPKVATVDQNGKVTGKKKGTAIITATAANGVWARAIITVKPAPTKVTLNKSGTVKLKKGKKLKLKAKLPSGTASALTWKSSKPSVATVSPTGQVVAVGKGTTTITVKTFNRKKATVKITVK